MVDEFTRQCLAIEVARKQSSRDVLRMLAGLMLRHGIRNTSDRITDPSSSPKPSREWLSRLEVGTVFIEPGSPWENGYIESFNGKLRDELLNAEGYRRGDPSLFDEAASLDEIIRVLGEAPVDNP